MSAKKGIKHSDYYMNEDEIAKELGVSRTRINQITVSALRKIRSNPEAMRKLREYVGVER